MLIELLTNLVQHLVTLVKNEMTNASKPKLLVANKRIKPSGSCDNDVRMCILVVENLDILLDRRATVKDHGLDVWHILGESDVLVTNLIRQFARVAHDEDRCLAGDRFELLKRGEDKDGRLSETRFGLADYISSENRLRDDLLLDC
jgi:hypothetical protein